MKLSGIVHYTIPYCTSYLKFLYSTDFGVSQSKTLRTLPYKTWGSGGYHFVSIAHSISCSVSDISGIYQYLFSGRYSAPFSIKNSLNFTQFTGKNSQFAPDDKIVKMHEIFFLQSLWSNFNQIWHKTSVGKESIKKFSNQGPQPFYKGR